MVEGVTSYTIDRMQELTGVPVDEPVGYGNLRVIYSTSMMSFGQVMWHFLKLQCGRQSWYPKQWHVGGQPDSKRGPYRGRATNKINSFHPELFLAKLMTCVLLLQTRSTSQLSSC